MKKLLAIFMALFQGVLSAVQMPNMASMRQSLYEKAGALKGGITQATQSVRQNAPGYMQGIKDAAYRHRYKIGVGIGAATLAGLGIAGARAYNTTSESIPDNPELLDKIIQHLFIVTAQDMKPKDSKQFLNEFVDFTKNNLAISEIEGRIQKRETLPAKYGLLGLYILRKDTPKLLQQFNSRLYKLANMMFELYQYDEQEGRFVLSSTSQKGL